MKTEMNLQDTFVENLKSVRKERGLTQDELADRAKISVDHVRMIETGKRFPSVTVLEAISKALDIPTFELFIDDAVVKQELGDSVRRMYIRKLKQGLTQYLDELDL